MVATNKNLAALAILAGLLGLSLYYIYKEYKSAPPVTATSMMNRYKPLDGLGVGKSYTFPRNSMPQDPSFVKEV